MDFRKLRAGRYEVVDRGTGLVCGTVERTDDGGWLAVATDGSLRFEFARRWIAAGYLKPLPKRGLKVARE